jgi:3-oxoacyl-[acyl-carrier protein] reductase
METASVAATPLGRTGTPDDYGSVVAFLASDDARWITGDVILVSGGQR